jgi:hypothetical protein
MDTLKEAIDRYAKMQDAIQVVSKKIAEDRANEAAEAQAAALVRASRGDVSK